MEIRIRKRSLKIAGLVLALLFTPFSTIKASDNCWTIDLSSLDHNISSYIDSIVVEDTNEGHSLYINDIILDTKVGNTVTFNYYPNNYTIIHITVDSVHKQMSFEYSKTLTDLFVGEIVFTIGKDGEQNITIYPDNNNKELKFTKMATNNTDSYDFGKITYQLEGVSHYVIVSIAKETNIATLNIDGEISTRTLEGNGAIRKITYESKIPATALELEYLENGLTKYDFTTAQTHDEKGRLYTSEQINQALSGKDTYELKNTTTDEPIYISLTEKISHARRIGEDEDGNGIYVSVPGEEIQIVCQWDEAACASVREEYGTDGRLFAVYGEDTTYRSVENGNETERTVNVTTYQNWYWNDTDWQEASYYSNIPVKSTTIVDYQKKTATWGNYGSYQNYNQYEVQECDATSECSYKTRTQYRSKAMYKNYVSDWTTEPDYNHYEYELRNIYSKAIGSWSAWSTNTYSKNDTAYKNCLLTEDCKTNKVGINKYQLSYRTWGSWSEYTTDKCSASDTVKCKSITQARYYEYLWTDWSSYSSNVCVENAGTQCQQRTQYSYRYLQWSDWDTWTRTTQKVTTSDTTKIQYRYNVGYGVYESEKGYSTQGIAPYYTGTYNVRKNYVVDYYAKEAVKNVGVFDNMTKALIEEKTLQLTNSYVLWNALNSLSQGAYRPLISEVETEAIKNRTKYLITSYNQAMDAFENQNIFIPYIYIKRHWHKSTRTKNIPGYDNENSAITSTNNTTISGNQTLDLVAYTKPTRETKVIYYDYREPLANYGDDIPSNWIGYEYLIDEIKNSDLGNYKISVELSSSDLKVMKKWLDEGGYDKLGTCEMLREFSYIFKITNSELESFFRLGSGCSIE